MDWEAVDKAYQLIWNGTVNRIDGDKWSMYRVGSIIRLDIKG